MDKKSLTVHINPAYSWELIEINNNYGLGEVNESGLKHNNNLLCFFRLCLARKTS